MARVIMAFEIVWLMAADWLSNFWFRGAGYEERAY